jgi:hypothetical protein
MTKQGWFHVLRRSNAKRQIAKLKELGKEMKARKRPKFAPLPFRA